jgi:hypothetical protein
MEENKQETVKPGWVERFGESLFSTLSLLPLKLPPNPTDEQPVLTVFCVLLRFLQFLAVSSFGVFC